MIPSIAAELFKLRKRSATWILAGAFVLTIVLFNYLFGYLGYLRLKGDPAVVNRLAEFKNQVLLQNFVPQSLGVIAHLSSPVVLILGALISGSEYGWSTFKTILT